MQMKRCTHQMQRAVGQRDSMRRDFPLKSEENTHITAECQLRRQDLRPITARKEQAGIKKHLCVQLRRQRRGAAQDATYTLAISQIRLSFEHTVRSQMNGAVSEVNKKFSPYTGKTYTVSSSNCPSFACATSSSLLMLTAGPRGQVPRLRRSRKRRSVCSILRNLDL